MIAPFQAVVWCGHVSKVVFSSADVHVFGTTIVELLGLVVVGFEAAGGGPEVVVGPRGFWEVPRDVDVVGSGPGVAGFHFMGRRRRKARRAGPKDAVAAPGGHGLLRRLVGAGAGGISRSFERGLGVFFGRDS